MSTIHGIGAVRAHVGKLPAPETMTIAERRRAIRPRREGVRASTRDGGGSGSGGGPAGRVAADADGPHRCRPALLARRRLRHRLVPALIGTWPAPSPQQRESRVCFLTTGWRLNIPSRRRVDDAVAAYRWLLERGVAGRANRRWPVTLRAVVSWWPPCWPCVSAACALPAAGVCISPWVDLTCSGRSYNTKAASDPIVKRQGVLQMAQHYLGGADVKTPLASPLLADLSGLPPLLIHVGSDEVLLDDSIQLSARTRAAGERSNSRCGRI